MSDNCCSVCDKTFQNSNNRLLTCGNCSLIVHQGCYGVQKVDGVVNWFCRKCESQVRQSKIRCELCPIKEGAFKRSSGARCGWAHMLCAFFIPEVYFKEPETMELIMLDNVPTDRFGRSCIFCERNQRSSQANHGVCIQCAWKTCRTYFHVTCAHVAGLLSDLPSNKASATLSLANVLTAQSEGLAHNNKQNNPCARSNTVTTNVDFALHGFCSARHKEKFSSVAHAPEQSPSEQGKAVQSPTATKNPTTVPSPTPQDSNRTTSFSAHSLRHSTPTAVSSPGSGSETSTTAFCTLSANVTTSEEAEASNPIKSEANSSEPSTVTSESAREQPASPTNKRLCLRRHKASSHITNGCTDKSKTKPNTSVIEVHNSELQNSKIDENQQLGVGSPVPLPKPECQPTGSPVISCASVVSSSVSGCLRTKIRCTSTPSSVKSDTPYSPVSVQDEATQRHTPDTTAPDIIAPPKTMSVDPSISTETLASLTSDGSLPDIVASKPPKEANKVPREPKKPRESAPKRKHSGTSKVNQKSKTAPDNNCSTTGIPSSSADQANLPFIWPQRPLPLRGIHLPNNNEPSLSDRPSGEHATDAVKSFTHSPLTTMQDLLEWQWDQAGALLMQQAAGTDVVSLLDCLHQLKVENDLLEAKLSRLQTRQEHLRSVNARLSASLATMEATMTTSTTTTSPTGEKAVVPQPSSRSTTPTGSSEFMTASAAVHSRQNCVNPLVVSKACPKHPHISTSQPVLESTGFTALSQRLPIPQTMAQSSIRPNEQLLSPHHLRSPTGFVPDSNALATYPTEHLPQPTPATNGQPAEWQSRPGPISNRPATPSVSHPPHISPEHPHPSHTKHTKKSHNSSSQARRHQKPYSPRRWPLVQPRSTDSGYQSGSVTGGSSNSLRNTVDLSDLQELSARLSSAIAARRPLNSTTGATFIDSSVIAHSTTDASSRRFSFSGSTTTSDQPSSHRRFTVPTKPSELTSLLKWSTPTTAVSVPPPAIANSSVGCIYPESPMQCQSSSTTPSPRYLQPVSRPPVCVGTSVPYSAVTGYTGSHSLHTPLSTISDRSGQPPSGVTSGREPVLPSASTLLENMTH